MNKKLFNMALIVVQLLFILKISIAAAGSRIILFL